MSALEAPVLEDHDWEIPSHELALYGEKRHRYALVIPVINEGDRIRGQLRRTEAENLAVDVVVADGGSTDGSLDAEFVKSAGVRAVLTKTGPGKLSAQLRMAYAWCLQQGYEGIVTIDGNGKDGVEAVADFVAQLDAGCDYVQGSRYLPGGEAENTPLERTIANRLIHAPLLSLAGRRVFTDTTNGFRAYSSRYLTHPDVQPFREEFQVYGLLFYLTARAGQLGLKIGHVPVVRRYPDDGKVPTKIGGLSSKLALLGETVFAATGGYTPDQSSAKHPSLFWAALIALLVALPLFAGATAAPKYSADSWAFFELSKTIFSDFYRFTHFRSYAEPSPYSSAFPPLWPTLIAIVDGAFNTGARTGFYLAFMAFLAFTLVSEQIGRRVTGTAWLGLVVGLLLLLGPKLIEGELEAGRTIPLQLFLYGLVLLGLLRGKAITVSGAIATGIVSGLAVLNRFDAVLLPVVSAGLILWLTRKPAKAAVALGASAIAISPWVVYSWTTFGVPFATDNSGIVTSLDPRAFVTDWWPGPQLNLADDPLAWLARVSGNIATFAHSGGALLISAMGLAFAAAAATLAGLQHLMSRRPMAAAENSSSRDRLKILVVFAVLVAAMMGPQVLTGYLEYRYFNAFYWVGFLVAACWLVLQGQTLTQRHVFANVLALIVGSFVVLHSVFQISSSAADVRGADGLWTQFDSPRSVAELAACLNDKPKARVLVIGENEFAARAGALGGLSTMMEPRNLEDGRLDAEGSLAFIKAWKVDYILVLDASRSYNPMDRFNLTPVETCPLPLFALGTGANRSI